VLIANWLGDQLGIGLVWTMVFIGVAMHYAKKFGNANPEVKDAAKKVAVSKTIELIGRMIKK
jgi:hypothetical protein